MAPRSAWVFGGATALSLATATAAAVVAARGHPLRLLHPRQFWSHYSLGNSAVDVVAYAWLHSTALLVLVGAGLRDARRAKKVRREEAGAQVVSRIGRVGNWARRRDARAGASEGGRAGGGKDRPLRRLGDSL